MEWRSEHSEYYTFYQELDKLGKKTPIRSLPGVDDVDMLYINSIDELFNCTITDIVSYASIDGLDPKKIIELIRTLKAIHT